MLLSLGACLTAHAEIFKHVDADGHVTYSNVPMKGATRLNLEPSTSGNGKAGQRASSTATPAGFPRVDQSTQKGRDDKRKAILEQELEAERKALDDAKKNLAEDESNPETFKRAVTTKVCKPVTTNTEKLYKFATMSPIPRPVEMLPNTTKRYKSLRKK